MKQFILTVCALMASLMLVAQEQFEGTILMKVMTSYSSKITKAAPYLQSFGDTCEVTVKGDDLHLFYKTVGMHKIVKDGRIYCWNDNTHKGFTMPIFSTHTENGQWIETNATKDVIGVPAHLYKKVQVSPQVTTEEEGWMAVEKPYAFSQTALQNLSAVLFANYLFPMDFSDLFCLKYTSRMLAGERFERGTNLVASTGVSNSIAGNDMSQAQHGATNEVGASFTYQIFSIDPHQISGQVYNIPEDVTFTIQENAPTTKDYVILLHTDLFPSMRGTIKGPMGKMMMELSMQTIDKAMKEQAEPRGQKPEDALAALYFLSRESIMQVEDKKLQKKEAKKKKDEKSNKEEKVVVYDINEEWDF